VVTSVLLGSGFQQLRLVGARELIARGWFAVEGRCSHQGGEPDLDVDRQLGRRIARADDRVDLLEVSVRLSSGSAATQLIELR
jgi:hypothetical protein